MPNKSQHQKKPFARNYTLLLGINRSSLKEEVKLRVIGKYVNIQYAVYVRILYLIKQRVIWDHPHIVYMGLQIQD